MKKKKIKIIKGKPFKLTPEQQQFLKWLQDWQDRAAKSDYLFTDKPMTPPRLELGTADS